MSSTDCLCKKEEQYRSMRGLPSLTQNSCEEKASLELRSQFYRTNHCEISNYYLAIDEHMLKDL